MGVVKKFLLLFLQDFFLVLVFPSEISQEIPTANLSRDSSKNFFCCSSRHSSSDYFRNPCWVFTRNPSWDSSRNFCMDFFRNYSKHSSRNFCRSSPREDFFRNSFNVSCRDLFLMLFFDFITNSSWASTRNYCRIFSEDFSGTIHNPLVERTFVSFFFQNAPYRFLWESLRDFPKFFRSSFRDSTGNTYINLKASPGI